MINNNDIMNCIEKLREINGLTINDLCEGICSRRQYTRYKNEENGMIAEVFVKLINKLNISVSDFLYYVHMSVNLQSSLEVKFKNLCLYYNYKEAFKYYEDITAPDKAFYEIKGCGHTPQADKPEEVANIIAELMR